MKKFILGIVALLSLSFGFLFAQNISPDSITISVKDPIIMGEATNLKITVIKNGTTMTSYDGSIRIVLTEQDGTSLKLSDYTVPNRGTYTFLPSDLGEKEFQRGLEIKKEGTFYIEISDLNENGDKILGKQLIHVIRKDSTSEVKDIDIYYPLPNTELISDKVEIIAMADEIPNSEAIVYIDDNIVGTTMLDSNGSINYTIGNITPGQHTLSIEIPNLEGDIIGRSDKIPFTISAATEEAIEVTIDPEKGLLVGDMVNIFVHTDDMVESVKLRLSDRPEKESIIMNKIGVGQFSQNVQLIKSGEISLSFETSLFNNTVTHTHNQYKTISVSDVPFISKINIETDSKLQSGTISWETANDDIVSSYLVDWRIEGSSLSGKRRSTKDDPTCPFSDIPYDTLIKFNITPYRDDQTRHGSASETTGFLISSSKTEPTIILGPSCPIQKVSTRTEKIGNNYYLIRDKAEGVTKYIIYSSSTPDGKNKVKVYETKDTSYEYPFDHKAKDDIFMYFRIVGMCDSGDEIELTGATKIQVGPGENFFLLMCLTLLIYSGIKLFRQTE